MAAANHTNTLGYRGLLIPDPRITPNTWEGTTTFTEANPRPGQAIPASDTIEGVVTTAGIQDDTTYSITCLKGGYNDGGEYGWAPIDSGVTGTLRGCDAPNCALDVRHIGGGSTSATTAGSPVALKTGSGRVVWLWVRQTVSTGIRRVHASYTDDGVTIVGADNAITLYSDSDADDEYTGYTTDNADCVCARWDADRQVVQAWIRVTDPVSTNLQFLLYESADEAETWGIAQKNCLTIPYSPDYTTRRPSIALVAGTLILLQPDDDGSTNYALGQFVSGDHGRKFDVLHADSSVYHRYSMAEFSNKVVISAIAWASDDLYVTTLGSAFDSVQTADWGAISITSTGYAALCTEHGRLYILYSPVQHYKIDVKFSLTGAFDDWQSEGNGLFSYEGSATGVDIEALSAVGAFGGVMLAFRASDTGTRTEFRDHLFAIRCGGWRTWTMSRAAPIASNMEGRAGFGELGVITVGTFFDEDRTTWYPFCAPDTITGSIWTVSGAGTVGFALTDGASPLMTVATTAGQAKYWNQDYTGDLTKGVLVYFDVSMTAGGSISDPDSAVRVSLSDGVTEYRVNVLLSYGSGVYLFDSIGAGSSMGATALTTRRAFVLAVREITPGTTGYATLYSLKYATATPDSWTYLTHLSLAPETSSPAASSSVKFGVVSTHSAVAIAQSWYACHFLAASGLPLIYDPALVDITGSPIYLAGAPMASKPEELQTGFRVGFTGGPTKSGDIWTVAPKYDYAKEHVYPHLYPSPRQAWRSSADNLTQTFQWLFNADEAPEGLGSTVWAVAMMGCNFAEWKLEGRDSGGTWRTILDVDNAAEFTSLNYRAGVRSTFTAPYITVGSSGSGAAGRYIHENELAGGSAVFASQVYKILRNTAGYWSTQTGKKPTLFLDGWDTGIASTGTLDIWPPNVLALKTGLGSTEYTRLRLVISATVTADGYYTIGQLAIGPVAVWGKQYSHGRVLTRTANVGKFATPGGVNNTVRNGPTFRTMQFGWFEGIDQTDIYETVGLTSEPDYVTLGDTASAATVVAARYDTATQMDGLLTVLDGPMQPVVVVNNIPFSNSSNLQYVFTVPDSFLYGRVQDGITRTTVRGTENTSEIAQIAAINIQEDV